MTLDACQACGTSGARTHLDKVLLCDRCSDKQISELTGFPQLPDPPPPMTLRDGEGRRRTLAFRLWRAPTGVEVVVEETGVPLGEGYERAVLGAHDADVDVLVARLCEIAAEEIGRRQLEPNPHRDGWLLVDDVVEGRLVWCEGREVGTPYNVVVDGRVLSWDELGRAFEGPQRLLAGGDRQRLQLTRAGRVQRISLAPPASLLDRLVPTLAPLLEAHGIYRSFIDIEMVEASGRRLAKTSNRSVLGSMNEFAYLADVYRDSSEVLNSRTSWFGT